jgi:carbon-monoxide dehydrogenase large subunit
LDVELDVDTGAYFTGAAIATGNAVTSCWGAYRVPNLRVRARTAYTNKVPSGTFRNTGKNQTTFGLDCAMDSLAHEIGIGPADLRRKNILRRGETQAVDSWTRNGKVGPTRLPPVDTDLSELIDHALRAIGWDGKPQGKENRGQATSRWARGRGLAVSLRRGANVGDATAMASMDQDGRVTIAHNAPDVGEGAHTMIAVVAARSLGIAPTQVRVEEDGPNGQRGPECV